MAFLRIKFAGSLVMKSVVYLNKCDIRNKPSLRILF